MDENRLINKIPPKQLARVLGLLPQSPIVPEGITVADLVGRGRYPHQPLLKGWTKRDYKAVAEAMEIMKITEFAHRNIDTSFQVVKDNEYGSPWLWHKKQYTRFLMSRQLI